MQVAGYAQDISVIQAHSIIIGVLAGGIGMAFGVAFPMSQRVADFRTPQMVFQVSGYRVVKEHGAVRLDQGYAQVAAAHAHIG